MNTYVALFRGVNVGGKNILPMKELASVLEAIGLCNVKTCIQSGNVVFQCDTIDKRTLAHTIRTSLGRSHGFMPEVLILSIHELQNAIAANPFPDGTFEPKTLQLFFLASAPASPDIARLEAVRTDREEFRLTNTVLYLHAPDGIGRSRLAAKVEEAMGVSVTARNWRSVNRIMAMAVDLS